MELYDKSNNKICINNLEYLNDGCNGNIYKLSDYECLKFFKSKDISCDLEVIKKIKDMQLDNFYEIRIPLFNKDKKFVGYIMKYYENLEIDILTMPVEYTLNNLISIYNSIIKLTDNNILIDDLDSYNIIFNRDKIIIIDCDKYTFNDGDNYTLKYNNIKCLEKLFVDLYFDSLFKYHKNEDSSDCIPKIYRLFRFRSYDENKRLDNTCKRLIKYKYPIDLIREK